MENFLGELTPFYGKWNWPLSQMQPGDFFVVDHARRDPEAVRNYVSMRGARLGKYFSIMARDPERPGFCRVSCTPAPELREEPVGVAFREYGDARAKFMSWYGFNLDHLPAWDLEAHGRCTKELRARQMPPVSRCVFDFPPHVVGAKLGKDRVDFFVLPAGSTVESWIEQEKDELAQIMA